ncbi:Inositol polyphosphate 1-phosphatase [Paragonimus heterotremus]|uniref:Inositol polyphosphate 1-phosphatase n=1 Tax=Paragonimus heterotremus TaxID=100268 RepID=A0A8J4TPX5_9TREM|nr:Inositol polyphosphate 1-phosphatase [Paragonimus heterotremus]
MLSSLDNFRTHTAVQSAISGTRTTSLNDVRLDLSLCELWVDPIDATAEYAGGVPICSSDSIMITDFVDQLHSLTPCTSRYISGTLANVTVLIGVFDRISGIPFLGVVNQPFYLPPDSGCSDTDTSFHSGRLFWGFRSPDFTSPTTSPCQVPISSTSVYRQVSLDCPLEDARSDALLRVVCSYPEVHRLERIFQSWSPNSCMSPTIVLLSSPGAGFKLMSLCRAEVDVYLLLSPSAYFWDTCAPHAILRSLSPDGGGLIRLSIAVAAVRQMLTDPHPESSELISSISSRLTEFQVVYTPKQPNHDLAEYRHSDGLLAYRNGQLASRLLLFLAVALPSV